MPTPGEFNAVLAAQTLNPSIFTHTWLAKHGLFEEKHFMEPGGVYSPPFTVNVVTSELSFLAIPERIQVSFTAKIEDAQWCQHELHRTIGKIAKELPHTPFIAIGFNMDWVVKPKGEEMMVTLERKHFLNPANPLAKYFDDASCRFGLYLSKDFTMGRLKLDIKPITHLDASQGTRLGFNFHLDLKEDKNAQISRFLDHWTEAYTTAEKYVTEVETTWNH